MAARNADLIEARVFAAGGVAAAVRTLPEWLNHPQGRAVASEPLIGHQVAGAAPPRRRRPAPPPRRRRSRARPDPGDRGAGMHALPGRARGGGASDRPARPARYERWGGLGHAPRKTQRVPRSGARPAGPPPCTTCSTRLTSSCTATGPDPSTGSAWVLWTWQSGTRGWSSSPSMPGATVVPGRGDGGSTASCRQRSGIATSESGRRRRTRRPALPTCSTTAPATWLLPPPWTASGDRRRQVARSCGPCRWRATAAWLTGFPTGSGSTTEGPAAGDPRSDAAVRPAWLVDIDGPGGAATAVAPPGALDGRPLAWPAIAGGYGEDAPAWGSR